MAADVKLLPEVLDDGLGLRLTPDDGVLFDGAAGFVFCGEHSAHVSVRAHCDHAGLLLSERHLPAEYCHTHGTLQQIQSC